MPDNLAELERVAAEREPSLAPTPPAITFESLNQRLTAAENRIKALESAERTEGTNG